MCVVISHSPPKKRVTLRDIANATGVSRMTVSSALRGDVRVALSTRRRIFEEAQRQGYHANPHLSRLMREVVSLKHRDHQGLLIYLHTEETKDGWKRDEIYPYICKQAERHGYRVEPFWASDPSLSPNRISQILWARGVDGILVPSLSHDWFVNANRALQLDWSKFCAVEISDTLTHPILNLVRHNHFEAMLMALDQLETIGYRRIGLCMRSDDDLRTHHRWVAAYLLWHTMRGQPSDFRPLIVQDYSSKLLSGWVEKHAIDVVISPGLSVLHVLRKSGFKIPEDVGFASLDLWGKGWKSVTGIDQQQARVIGPMAVDQLVGLIRQRARGVPDHPVHWVHPGTWKNGKTTLRRGGIPAATSISEQALILEV